MTFFGRCAVVATVVVGLGSAAGATAAPLPVDPLEVARSTQLGEAQSFVAPGGAQLISFRAAKPGGNTSVLVERTDGNPFSDQIDLIQNNNAGPPSLSFTGDGGIYAIVGIATSGAVAQQSVRPPGGEFGPLSPVTNCNRFVDSAAGPNGEIAVVCSHNEAAVPPNTYWLGTSPTLGPVTVNGQINPAVYDSFIKPEVAWGKDGTLAVVADYWTTTTAPPPANQTKRVRATVRNAAKGVFATIDFPNVTQPNDISVSGPVVLDDGTVAFSTSGTAGARVQIRPPGAATAFAASALNGEGATAPQVDGAQNLHVMTGNQGPPRQYWSNVRPPGGSFGTQVPIPLAGADDPYIPYDGFAVAPDGTEYAVIRAGDGIYATSREPGRASFEPPRLLGAGDATNNPGVAVTPESDFLVSWPVEAAAGDHRLFVGGLDKTPPEVSVSSFPTEAAAGAVIAFSAEASDQMGMRSTGWDFGDGKTVNGGAASQAFAPGDHPVTFTATDRAGNETVVRRTVRVPGSPVIDDPVIDDPLVMKVVTPKKMRFRALGRRGVKVKVTANKAVRIGVRLGTSKAKARRKPLRSRRVKRLKSRHVLRVKPVRRRLGKRRKLKLFVRVTGTTPEGESLTRVKRVRVRR